MKKTILLTTTALAMALVTQAQDLCSDLRAMYTFNNDANNQNGNQPFSNPAYDLGKVGQGLLITGASKAATTSLVSGSGNRTVAMWVWRGSNTILANYPAVFYYGGINNQPGERFGVYYNTDSSLTFQGFGNGFDHPIQNSKTNTGQWIHLALTYNGSDVSCYINGTLRDAWAVSLSTNGSTMYLGGSNTYAVYDDLRIYSRALNTSEIQFLYNNPESEPCCTVDIPDSNFKAALVNHTLGIIDTDGDGEIQCSEAASFTGTIGVYNKNISDLTGIEAFIRIEGLNCGKNQLTGVLNLSSNAALRSLDCFTNLFTGIDVTGNAALTRLNCSENQLTSLNVSTNTALTQLSCDINQLTTLNLSTNIALTSLGCVNNQLTSLNLANGNNVNFNSLWAFSNPSLNCIQVDNAAYSTANWVNGTFANEDPFVYDASVSFNENCPTTSIKEVIESTLLNMYPNPTAHILHIEVAEVTEIKIVNLLGASVTAQKLNAGINSIDVSMLAHGVYFVQPLAGNAGALKFIKQ